MFLEGSLISVQVPQDENLPTCAPSNHHTTSWGVNID